MFDISWTEFLLIGIVALVVIGPKELPGVLRTLGQWMRKVRSMAGDFQNQFQEAMREAEMADLKKQVDDMAHDFKHFDPLKEVRNDVEGIGKDLERSLDAPLPAKAAPPETGKETGQDISRDTDQAALSATPEAASIPTFEAPAAAVPIERRDLEPAGAPQPAVDAAQPDRTERTG